MDALPLRIEWRIATPWCPPPMGLHLDGLIGHALVQEAEANGREFLTYDALLAELPFERHEAAAGWCWKASLVRPSAVHGSERRYMTSKTAGLGLAERMVDGGISGRALKSIDTVRGPFKNDAFWYTVEHVPACHAWCVGDPERIASLLDRITHLGKRSRLDHGRIALRDRSDAQEGGLDFDIIEDADALVHWQERVMPEPLEGYAPVVSRLQPPYWKGEGVTQAWRPL